MKWNLILLKHSLSKIFLFQRTNDETGQTVVDMIQKCGSDCRKFTLQEMVLPVAKKENYVSIMVSLLNFNRKSLSLLKKYFFVFQ